MRWNGKLTLPAVLAATMTMTGCGAVREARSGSEVPSSVAGFCKAREPLVRDHAAALAALGDTPQETAAKRTGVVLMRSEDRGCVE